MRAERPLGTGPQQRLARLAGLVPTRPSSAARTPFVLLVVLLLGSGMLGLLFLNASLNEGSFELSELRRESRGLSDERQELQAEVDGFSAPGALAERARELGLVPGGAAAFIGPDGSVLGDTEPAPPPPPEPETSAGPRSAAEGDEQAAPPDTADTPDNPDSADTSDSADGAGSAEDPAGAGATPPAGQEPPATPPPGAPPSGASAEAPAGAAQGDAGPQEGTTP